MKTCIVAIAKQENNYIREWVEYHKALGFDNIILCDNNDIDGEKFEDVINDFITSGYVIIKNYRGHKTKQGQLSVQNQSYTNVYNEYKCQYDWMLYIDIDEFFEFTDKTMSLSNFLNNSAYNDFNQIRICWKNFGDDGLAAVKNNDYNVRNRFLTRVPLEFRDKEVKSFIRCSSEHRVITAHGCLGLKSCDINGHACLPHGCYIEKSVYDIACICHYRTKTIEEFILQKIKRGHGSFEDNSLSDSLNIFWEYNKKTPEKLAIIKKYIN